MRRDPYATIRRSAPRKRPPLKPLKWKRYWHGGKGRFDLALIGEPDCSAWIMRYSHRMYGGVWCWELTIPRASGHTVRGWNNSPHIAKRQVETAIEEHWR